MTEHCRKLEFAGSMTIREAEATRAELVAALADSTRVEVECQRVTEVDLSFVQLLLAARRSAERAGTVLTLKTAASGALLAVLRQGGFLAEDGAETAASQFWIKAGE